MEYRYIDETNRYEVNEFIREQWFSTDMVVRGKIVDLTKVEGIVVYEEGKIIGLETFSIEDSICEILSLDSLIQGKGIGTELIHMVIALAKERGCKKVILITTNDNINAIAFYQKRGFDMAHLYHNALEVSRRLKSEIPLIGEHGIKLMHEIEFEYIL